MKNSSPDRQQNRPSEKRTENGSRYATTLKMWRTRKAEKSWCSIRKTGEKNHLIDTALLNFMKYIVIH